MDPFAADFKMNGMAPRGMVAYHTAPYGIVPAHSAALVVIPNGIGGLLQYGWFTGACCRILNQDSIQIGQLFRQGQISQATYETMLMHLGSACGADTPEMYHQRCQVGAMILASYQTVGIEDQIFWLRHDAEVRPANMMDYYKIKGRFNDTAISPQAYNAYASDRSALDQLSSINLQQLKHIQDVMIGLMSLLPKEKAIEIAELCEVNIPDSEKVKKPPANEAHAAQSIARQPLGPISPNIKTKVPAQQGESLKRKRPDPTPKPMSEVVDLLDDSEDEDTLQIQVDAFQAKIAAIRKRTAHEDQLVPDKRPKVSRQAPKTATTFSTAAASFVATKPDPPVSKPSTASSSPSELVDPFAPPRSCQNVTRAGIAPVNRQQGATGVSLYTAGPSTAPRSSQQAPRTSSTNRTSMATIAGDVKPLGARDIREEQRMLRESFLASCTSKSGKPLPMSASRMLVDLTTPSPAQSPAKPSQSKPIKGNADTSSDHPAPRDQPVLCQEQQEVVDCIMAGHNVFYTGSAGCGKSTVLKTFVPLLREQGKTVRIVAPTGKAALDINGSTTWTFAGWTPLHMKRPLEKLVKEAHGKFVRRRLRGTDVLVIDEISMVENHLFARLDAIMKEAREDSRAFGGVQLIVTGDFCQLPPVKPFQYCMYCGREQPQRIVGKDKTVYRCPVHGDCNDDDKWAFRSAAWEECRFKHINLTNIHRQSDELFIRVLQKLRIGTALTETNRRLLLNHPCDTTNAVKLFPTRDQVKRINQTEFDRLTSVKHSYTCLNLFSWNERKHPHLESRGNRSPVDDSLDALREHRLDTLVEYKKDMLVVLLVNLDIDNGLVNGSQGRIVGFESYDEAKLPKANIDGMGGGSRTLSSKFNSSQSRRMQRASSMEIEGGTGAEGELRGEYAFLREGQIRDFINSSRNKSKMWPVVEFDNGLKRTIYADCRVNELGDEKEYTLLARTQIPLIAAWAMTIHKSQGMTLNKVIVDLGKSFEEGQEYVALSRARSLEGLKVTSLGDGVGKGGNAQVKEFLWRKFKLR